MSIAHLFSKLSLQERTSSRPNPFHYSRDVNAACGEKPCYPEILEKTKINDMQIIQLPGVFAQSHRQYVSEEVIATGSAKRKPHSFSLSNRMESKLFGAGDRIQKTVTADGRTRKRNRAQSAKRQSCAPDRIAGSERRKSPAMVSGRRKKMAFLRWLVEPSGLFA